ncbi:AAA family ATPase [Corallococcus exercitus]|uniref:AAA family ATPase n=1 Tax=Corallococcus exercitus TaxID=2316736 RepID=A0A7Y4KJ39_9BACT|nr:AAA family ATPase [Corallococcus exercitus]NOK33869.1 AAA family ATPase [Corallococcus exercitus]
MTATPREINNGDAALQVLRSTDVPVPSKTAPISPVLRDNDRMRHVDRNAVPVPGIIASVAALRAKARARTYFSEQEDVVRKQSRFDFEQRIWLETRDVLFTLFAGKCAYCETPLGTLSQVSVDHFRPKGSVRETSGTRLDHGYWWLAYAWENLYPACRACTSYKHDAFPLEEESARARSPSDPTQRERPLLLDPCEDWPEEHLRYLDNGRVEGLTSRGATTIALLRLDRAELVENRRRQMQEFEGRFNIDPIRVSELLESSVGYVQAVWQRLARFAQQQGTSDSWRTHLRTRGVHLHTLQILFSQNRELTTLTATAPSSRPDTAAPALNKRTVAVRIRRVEIQNIRAVHKLCIDLPQERAAPVMRSEDFLANSPGSGQETLPWLLLLGENATGKSTVLEALALALIGQEELDERQLSPARWLTRGKRVGHITVTLREGSEERTIRLRIDATGFHFEEGGEPLSHLIRGYGRARLPGGRRPRKRSNIDVENLFYPREGLVDVDYFFGSLSGATNEDAVSFDADTPSQFDLAVRAVWDVLRGARPPEGSTSRKAGPSADRYFYISKDDRRLHVKLDDEDFAFEELSAGYQSTVSLIADILAGEPGGVAIEPHELTGIVLLDEIGTDLHPRWRRRIVRDLREALPNIQFVASTHEPLCLQGLQREDKIVLLRSTEPRVKVFGEGDPSPVGMRADQILTSRFFGLHSTIDEGLDYLFRHYYETLAKLVSLRETAEAKSTIDSAEIVDRLDAHEARIKELQRELENERRALDNARDEFIKARSHIAGASSGDFDTLTQQVEELRCRIVQQTGAAAERGNVVALRLGSTLREQRLLEIIDEEIARDYLPSSREDGGANDLASMKLLRAETKARVLALWRAKSNFKDGA